MKFIEYKIEHKLHNHLCYYTGYKNLDKEQAHKLLKELIQKDKNGVIDYRLVKIETTITIKETVIC